MPVDPSIFSAPFRMQPGLSRLAPGERHLTPNRLGDAVLGAKLAVLRNSPAQALCKLPDWDDRPALQTLAEQARREFPTAWEVGESIGGQRRWTARQLGWSLQGDQVEGYGPAEIGDCLRALPFDWRLAGLLSLAFAEDFAVIEAPAGRASRIPWLAVCLPSHWAPETKLGLSFAEVHGPVADNQALLHAADALVHLVTGPDRWQRAVWTLVPTGRIDGHPQRQPATVWPDDANAGQIADMAWLRTEHQTFIPLPFNGQAVFTIRVEVRRLTEVVTDPQNGRQVGHAMRAALASMSPAVLEYRRLSSARDRLLEWLDAANSG